MYQSQMITDAVVSDETNVAVCTSLGLSPQSPVQYMVFKTQLDDRSVTCCLAGGKVEGEEAHLTPVGTGAYEALQSISGNEIQVILLEDDDEAMKVQVSEIIANSTDGDRLCFISDKLVERQELLQSVFNLQ